MVLLMAVSTMPLPGSAQDGVPELIWGSDLRLSESTEISDDPTVAISPEGGMVVAWRERLLGRYNVFFVVLDENGAVVGERQQLGQDLEASMDPAVAVDSGGDLHFVWTAMEEQELWYAKASPEGTIELGPVQLTDANGDSAEVSIWLDNRDHLHLVWFDGREGTTWLYYMQLDQDGVKVVDDLALVQSLTEEESAIAMDSRGDLHIAWNAISAPRQIQWNTEVHYTKISNTGEVLVRDRLVATSRGNIGFPDMALDLSDNVHLVWPEGVGPRERVMYAQLDSSGRTITDPVEVGSPDDQPTRDVTLAVDGNDNLHIVWSQGQTRANDLVYITLAPGGERVGDPYQLTSSIADSREPVIGLSQRGEPRVVWSDMRSGNAEVYLKVANLPIEGVDLAVYSKDIAFDPPTVTADEEVEVQVLVHNHGDVASPRFKMTVQFDFGLAGDVDMPVIGPGETYLYTGHVTMEEGEHFVAVTVDPYNAVPETVENNNEAMRTMRAYPPGTLNADAGPDIGSVVGAITYLDATGTVYMGAGMLSYEWDFDDGTPTGQGLYVEHIFTEAGQFQVSLRVSDGWIEDTDTCLVSVRERDDPPHAAIDPEGIIKADRLGPVVLSAQGSTDDNGIENVTWDLGDGSTADTMVVSHSYSEPGLYVVTLTVTDARGQFDINKTTVEVVNLAPEIVDIDVPKEARVGDSVAFFVDAIDPDGQVMEIGWDFDATDGITFEATGSKVTFKFKEAGTYNVTCIIRDDDGGQRVVHFDVELDDGSNLLPGFQMSMVILALLGATIMSRTLARPSGVKDLYQSGYKRE
jgi:hypothetical protein